MVEDPQKTQKQLTEEYQKRVQISDQDPVTPGHQNAVEASLEREAREEGQNLSHAGVKAEPAKNTGVSAPAASAQEQNRGPDQGHGRG